MYKLLTVPHEVLYEMKDILSSDQYIAVLTIIKEIYEPYIKVELNKLTKENKKNMNSKPTTVPMKRNIRTRRNQLNKSIVQMKQVDFFNLTHEQYCNTLIGLIHKHTTWQRCCNVWGFNIKKSFFDNLVQNQYAVYKDWYAELKKKGNI